MADDDEPAVIDTRDTDKLLRRIEALSTERYHLKQQLEVAKAASADHEAKLAELGKAAKEAAKIAAERDALVAERSGWADERAILGAGITDAEGVDFVRLAWQRLPEESRPKGGLGEWLQAPDGLPKGVQAYLPQPAAQAAAQAGAQARPPPAPNAGARQAPAQAAAFSGSDIGALSARDFAQQRDAIWASLGVAPPKRPGST